MIVDWLSFIALIGYVFLTYLIVREKYNPLVSFYLNVAKFQSALELLEKMRRNDPINQNFLAWYYYTFGLEVS